MIFLVGFGAAETDPSTPLHLPAGEPSAEAIDLGQKYNSIADSIQNKVKEADITPEQFRLIADSTGTVEGVSSTSAEDLRSLVSQFRELHQGLRGETLDTSNLVQKVFSEEDSGTPASKREGSGKSGAEKEKEVEEEAQKRAAKKAADEKDKIRGLEQAQNQNQLAQQLAAAQQGNQGGKGKGNGSGGQDNSGGSQGTPNFPQQNNNNDNSQNQIGNGFDRLANRLNNLGNQGFGNFSSSQNSSKKDDEKKSNFSLPAAKNTSSSDFNFDSQPKKSLNLPQLQTGNQNMDLGKSGDFGMQGTPVPVAPFTKGSASSPSMNPSLNNGLYGSGMNSGMRAGMGGMLGGSFGSNQASMGSFGQDFPFNITGETPDPDSEYDGSPRYRVYDVSMTGASSGGGDGTSSGEAGGSNDLSSQSFKKNGVPQFLYFMTPEEQSLKGVPGIFRSLAAGYKKTRIQLFCNLKDRKKIGLCEKVRKDLEG